MADKGTSAVKRRLATGAYVLGALLVLGAILGPLWWLIAPRAEGTALGGGEVYTGVTEDVFAGEGYFALMAALVGLVTSYVTYMIQFPLARRRFQDLRMVCLVGGFLGSLGGAVLTWRLGVALDGSAHAAVAAAEPGATVQAGLQLNATAFLVVWPLVFVLQYGLLDAISLLRRDQPGVPARADAHGTDDTADTTEDQGVDNAATETTGVHDSAAPDAEEPIPAEHDQGLEGPGR